jgi:hypothetical protein
VLTPATSGAWREKMIKCFSSPLPDFKQIDRNPGGISESSTPDEGVHVYAMQIMFITKTAYPKVENSAQTTSGSSHISICAPSMWRLYMSDDNREKSQMQFQNLVLYSS